MILEKVYYLKVVYKDLYGSEITENYKELYELEIDEYYKDGYFIKSEDKNISIDATKILFNFKSRSEETTSVLGVNMTAIDDWLKLKR